ncbi:MAG: hypothetical protein ACI39W_10935, partial [Brotaphodocola sp.]
ETFQFIKHNNEWFCDANADGVLQENEMNENSGTEFLEDGRISASFVGNYDYHGVEDDVNSSYG